MDEVKSKMNSKYLHVNVDYIVKRIMSISIKLPLYKYIKHLTSASTIDTKKK